MSMNFSDIRERWLREQPTYERFARYIEEDLQKCIRSKGCWAQISTRVKEVDSFLKKILRKNYSDPFEQITDTYVGT